MAELTYRQLALGVVMSGLPGTTVPDWMADALRDGLAGVILFGENTPDAATARRVTDALRAIGPQVVISCDEEGGEVTRIQATTGSDVPSAAALGVVDDPELTRAVAQAYGRLISMAGIDLPLAPILDVASEPLNPVIGVRSFGDSPELVTRHGNAFVQGFHDAGVTGCAKHFPGHGDTLVDSHLGLPVIDVEPELYERRDRAPFAAVPVDSIMTAHIIVPAKGPKVASLSRWATDEIHELGHTGPIITDALGMKAVSAELGLGEAGVQALEAGADWLCMDAPHQRDARAALEETVDAIVAALESGRLDPAALVASRQRNLALQREHAPFDPAALRNAAVELEQIGSKAARLAVSSRGNVRVGSSPVFVDLRQRINPASGRASGALAKILAQRDPSTRVVPVDQLGTIAQTPAEQLVIMTTSPLADPAEGELLAALLETHPGAIVVHTGLASAAPDAPNVIFAHGSSRANSQAAAALLLGEVKDDH